MKYDPPIEPMVIPGIAGGLVAATTMALVAMIRSAMLGTGFVFPLKLIAGSVWGIEALVGGTGVVVLGAVMHLTVGGIAGLILALAIGRRIGPFGAMVGGIVIGIVTWAVSTWLLLPVLDPLMLDRVMMAPVWWFGYHLVFGAMLFVIPHLARNDRYWEMRSRAGKSPLVAAERDRGPGAAVLN